MVMLLRGRLEDSTAIPEGTQPAPSRDPNPQTRWQRDLSRGTLPAAPMDSQFTTVLETVRLRLRQVEESDAEFMVELLNEEPYIRFIADRGVRTTEDGLNYIRTKVRPSYATFGFGYYIVEIKSSGEAVGMCGLMKRETIDDVDIGYSILQRYWGQGYAFEAAAALLRYGREKFELVRIVGFTATDNFSSIKLLEKLGLRYEKTLPLPGYESESLMFV